MVEVRQGEADQRLRGSGARSVRMARPGGIVRAGAALLHRLARLALVFGQRGRV